MANISLKLYMYNCIFKLLFRLQVCICSSTVYCVYSNYLCLAVRAIKMPLKINQRWSKLSPLSSCLVCSSCTAVIVTAGDLHIFCCCCQCSLIVLVCSSPLHFGMSRLGFGFPLVCSQWLLVFQPMHNTDDAQIETLECFSSLCLTTKAKVPVWAAA